MRKRIKHNWEQLIPEWKASGLPVFTFCREQGICTNAMYNALKRRNISTVQALSNNETFNEPTFVPVNIISEPIESVPIIITIGKATISVDCNTDLSLLENTVRILSNIC